jgi:hypothetical protein
LVELSDFPKIECPFMRKTFQVNPDDFKKHGHRLQLRTPEAYLVINQVKPGFEWVFEDPDTIAVEKLDGTNVKLKTESGRLVSVYNRKNPLDPLQIVKGKTFLIEGIHRAVGKGYILPDGIQAGEIIGPKLQGNPYKLDNHIWYPFEKAIKDLRYRSFHEHDRTFGNWSSWFESWLFSRFFVKRRPRGSRENVFAEGVVFYNLRRKAEGLRYCAKLRRNMFSWFYTNEGVEIYGYKS